MGGFLKAALVFVFENGVWQKFFSGFGLGLNLAVFPPGIVIFFKFCCKKKGRFGFFWGGGKKLSH